MTIDRRTFVAAAGGALLSPALFAQPARFPELYAAAKKEGELTWYVAHYRTSTCESIGNLFSEVYPGIKVNVVRASGQVIYQRLSQDIKVKAHNCDVFSTSDQSHNLDLRKRNMLVQYLPKTLAECVPDVQKASDPEHYFTATDASLLLLISSTKLPEAERPKKWLDLVDPKWKGQVAVGHPGYSGSMGAWCVKMQEMYGWEFFEKLAKNKPHVSRSLADPPTHIISGERMVGLGPGGMTADMSARKLPIVPIIPAEGAQLGFGPTALIAGSPHPNAAKLFLEFQLSKPVGEIIAGLYGVPIRKDVEPKPESWAAGSVKGFRATAQEVDAHLPELVDKWRDLFGV